MRWTTRVLNLLPEGVSNEIRARRAIQRYPEYRRIATMPVAETGVLDGTPFVKLKDGPTFYGYPPTPVQKKVGETILGDSRPEICPESYGVACDLAYRYLGPESADQYLGAGKYYDLKPGQVAVEVGAFIGHFVMRAAEMVGDTGRVVAVEAIAENYEILRRNLEANDFPQVSVFNRAAWKTKGELNLTRESEQKASVLPDLIDGQDVHKVACDTVDNMVEELGLSQVDFVRIQVNGAEGEVLTGMTRTLEQKPTLLIAALYKVDGVPSWKRIGPRLESLGYQVSIDSGMILAKA